MEKNIRYQKKKQNIVRITKKTPQDQLSKKEIVKMNIGKIKGHQVIRDEKAAVSGATRTTNKAQCGNSGKTNFC